MKKFIIAFGIIFVGILAIMIIYSWVNGIMHPIRYNTGKDTVAVVGDGKFQIGKFNTNKVLIVFPDEKRPTIALLAFVDKYKIADNRLYVFAKEGYGVVDGENNTCKIFLTVEHQYLSDNKYENKSVTYLKSYDEFTASEKKIFDEMKASN